jgi:hypothetical protein
MVPACTPARQSKTTSVASMADAGILASKRVRWLEDAICSLKIPDKVIEN